MPTTIAMRDQSFKAGLRRSRPAATDRISAAARSRTHNMAPKPAGHEREARRDAWSTSSARARRQEHVSTDGSQFKLGGGCNPPLTIVSFGDPASKGITSRRDCSGKEIDLAGMPMIKRWAANSV